MTLEPSHQLLPSVVNARAKSFKNNIGSTAASAASGLSGNDYVNFNNVATWHALSRVSGIRP